MTRNGTRIGAVALLQLRDSRDSHILSVEVELIYRFA